ELAHDGRDRALLLTDRDIDTFDAARLLIDDRVDRERRLTGLTVADDEFALAAADRHHRVDRLVTGLHGLAHGLTVDDAGRDALDGRHALVLDRTFAVDRIAQRIDDAAEQPFAHRHFENASRRLDRVAFDDVLVFAQDHGTD